MKKREIIVDGQNSDWYEKAIFILKDNDQAIKPNNLIKYAEELIENSCKKGTIRKKHDDVAKKSFQDTVINTIFISGITTLILSFILLFL